MNKKTSFANSHLWTLATTCLAMTAFGCSKSDSLGSVRDGGTDGIGNDSGPDGGPNPSDVPSDSGGDGGDSGATYRCQVNADGTCSAVTPDTSCLPVKATPYDQVANCLSSAGGSTLYCTAWQTDAPGGLAGGLAPAEGCLQIPQDGGTLVYWTPESDLGNPWWNSHVCDASLAALVLQAPQCGSSPADAPVDSACQYPTDSHVSAVGDTVWWWRFHWQDLNLATTCAAWGADAKMVLEVDVPANPSGSGIVLPTCATDTLSTGDGPRCAMANAWRFEAACTDGELMVELPSSNVFHGYYHVESSTFPNSARNLVSQDVHCGRDLYLATGLASPPATSDGGVDAAPDGGGCPSGLHLYYTTPGCGTDAVPVCLSGADAALAIAQYCACDGVTTVTDDARGAISPYLYAGACKQDGGVDPCAACTANQVCVQSFDGICHSAPVACRTVSDTCRAKLSATSGKSCSSLPECESELCTSPYRCVYSIPCGTEAPQAALYCYGP